MGREVNAKSVFTQPLKKMLHTLLADSDVLVHLLQIHERIGNLRPTGLTSMEENVIKERKIKYRITVA